MTGDVCPTCGRLWVPPPEGQCECSHSEFVHRFGNSETATTGKRGACSRLSCGCTAYRPRGVPRG